MTLTEMFEYADKIFSDDGLTLNGITIECNPETNFKVKKNDRTISFQFSNNKPKIYVKKIIRFSLSLSGIHFSPSGGVLEIDNFPDIPFKYEEIH
jgi:hypothetical protein